VQTFSLADLRACLESNNTDFFRREFSGKTVLLGTLLETPQQVASAAAYSEGLSHWRKREFEAAAKCFEHVAEGDTPSTLFLSRANVFVSDPPGPDWEPVNALGGK
jgi:hypothetical protein